MRLRMDKSRRGVLINLIKVKTVLRKLVNICVGLALMTGCWGGVLAAAACPHSGCETMAFAPDVAATQSDHADTHGHDTASPEAHSSHVSAHQGHAAEPPARDQHQFSHGELKSVAPEQHDQSCAHCVGSPEAPSSPCFEWQSGSAKRGGGFVAPLAATQIKAPAAVFLREITPAQHAPPGQSDRHIILSVFRI